MRSLRTRITFTVLVVILVALAIVTALSTAFIRNTEIRKSDQLFRMLCESGAQSLNYYFDSVEDSVLRVSSFVEEDLEGLEEEQLEKHMDNAREYFGMMASMTKGVLTYYYRIDPSVSTTVKGFWYTNLDGNGFTEHEVTDITQYDVNDTSKLVWFTVPKHEGRAIWLPPYITDNLDVRVISYDAPVYCDGQFVGVVGIEVDYSTMADEVNSIRPYNNGYAYLTDADGALFYHPYIDVTELPADSPNKTPYPMDKDSSFARYKYDGVDKIVTWTALRNGMYLNVSAPASETEGEWRGLVKNICLAAVGVLLLATLFLMNYARRITRPLEQLTEAAEQADKGNYDVSLPYDGDDEIGRLTRSFKRLSGNMKAHINALNEQVFIDALTHVRNKGAYTIAIEEMQEQINNGSIDPDFAIGVFDCDGLKMINDKYGHDKGDLYLQKACHTISDVFKRSPVFRVGGDEFIVILKYEDFQNKEYLIKRFQVVEENINVSAAEPWDQVQLSKGFADYDPEEDDTATEVMQRADKLMYEDKRQRKILKGMDPDKRT